jgi:anti-sigma factor RsiW
VSRARNETVCAELVERISDFLDGTLDNAERVRLEQHLVCCEGCAWYLEQMRATTAALGRLAEPEREREPRDVTALVEDLLRRAGIRAGA